MSTVGMRKRYTSAMERIIKNAVSESGKVLETIIAELKAEVLRVKSENENLKIRCSQFEEVVKKRSIYRETGTSPEPYIIEKCDKAVQCELAFHQPVDIDPNISDNETQSECSLGPDYEKECSNDSFSFINMNEVEHDTHNPLDISHETSHEASFDPETNINDDKPEQKNKESAKYSETFTCSSDQVILTTISSPQTEQNEEHESCSETSEMEIQETCQEDVGIDCAKTHESFLECQGESQKEVNNSVTCEKSTPEDSSVVVQQQIETTEMEAEIDPQSKFCDNVSSKQSDKVSSANTTNADQLITLSKVTASTVTPTGPETDSRAFQSLSTEVPHARKAQKTSESLKYPYFLRRQRCTSVTLEDAMLLLDAVNLHEFKSSTPKKAQTKHSVRDSTTTRKTSNNPEVTQTFVSDNINIEENVCQAETGQPQMAEAIAEACPANIGKEGQQHNRETIPLTTPSPPQAAIDHSILMVTPTTKADSVSMDIEDHQHDIKILSSPTNQSSGTAMTNTTPITTLTKQGEDLQTVDNNTTTTFIEGQGHDQIISTTRAKPFTVEPGHVVEPIIQSVTPSKQIETIQAVDVNEYPIESVKTCADTALLSTSTELGETAQATADETQNNMVDVTPPSIMLPPESLIQPESEQTQAHKHTDETESVAQIDVHSSLDIESQENDITFSLGHLPPKPPLNPVTQHTLLLKMPGETGNKCDSVPKSITSSSTLSPAQLSAVVSAVRSTENTHLSAGALANIPSGKKALVAVPISLKSVMKPHHKIIVIPRQCKIPLPQVIVKDKMIVVKKKPFQKDATATVISTSDANLVHGTGDDSTTAKLDKQQSASVTTQALPKSDSLEIEQNSPVQENSPCKNTAQVKLNRLLFPVSYTQTVSVANMSLHEEKNATNSLSVKTINSETATSQPAAQPVQYNSTSTVIDTSPPNLSSKYVQTSPKRKIKSTSQSPTIVRLSPVVANDHSYPQNRMTKSQFLAKLEVSPVTQDSEKAGSSGKDVPKASLVDRLRSHLKAHAKSTKKLQDIPILTVETIDCIPINQEISSPDQEQSENVNLPTTLACIDENKSACPNIFGSPIKTASVTKRVSNVKQVRRKNCPKTDQMTPTKPVKKRRLKKGASSENILLRGNLSPKRNKLINSNALLSCVRKGLMKKSFLCKFCQKEFAKKKDIEEHIQVHVGKKPFQCNICHRRFSRTMELSRHLKRHNAEKKYQCTSCGKAFIEYNNLKRHTYIHTGEKPYPCPHCHRAFTQSGHMKTHVKNHHKDT